MKKILLILISLCLVFSCNKSFDSNLKPYKVNENIKVYFQEDSELPLISFKLMIPGGSLDYPSDISHKLSFAWSLLTSSGVKGLSSQDLELEIEKLSASFSSGISNEYKYISFSGLSSDFDQLFNLFFKMLESPSFEEKRVELLKGQYLESIKKRKENSQTIASLTLKKLQFENSVFYNVLNEKDLLKINSDSIKNTYQDFLHTENAIIAVSGDIKKETLNKYISRLTDFKKKKAIDFRLDKEFEFKKPKIYFINKPFTQSTILFSQIGPERMSPDEFRIRGFNRIFGVSGFSSKLVKRIRTELGLAYSAYGAISPDKDFGSVDIFIQTKSENAYQSISETLKLIKHLQSISLNNKEFTDMHNAATNSLIFRYDTPLKKAMRYAELDIMGYPADFDKQYLEQIVKVDSNDFNYIINKYINIDEFIIVVVGDESAYNGLIKAKNEGLLRSYEIESLGFENEAIFN